jgi:hypothetical protein
MAFLQFIVLNYVTSLLNRQAVQRHSAVCGKRRKERKIKEALILS